MYACMYVYKCEMYGIQTPPVLFNRVKFERALYVAKSAWGLRMDADAVKRAKELESYDDKVGW